MTVAATKKHRINIYCIVSAVWTEEITLAGRQVNRHSYRFRPEVFCTFKSAGFLGAFHRSRELSLVPPPALDISFTSLWGIFIHSMSPSS